MLTIVSAHRVLREFSLNLLFLEDLLLSEAFWTAIAAIGGLLSLLFIYRQVRNAADVASYELLRKEDDTFRGMLEIRASVAKLLLARPTDLEALDENADRILDYFEDLGYLLRSGVGSPYYMWVTNAIYIIHYWHALKPYMEWVRREWTDPTYFIEFEHLYNQVARIEARSRRLKELDVTKKDIRDFLETELNIHIRPFTLLDLPRVLAIERHSFPGDEAYDKEEFEDFFQSASEGFYVAEIAGEIVGYVNVHAEGDRGEIDSIAVMPALRSLHIGKILLRRAITLLEDLGIETCHLETRTTNQQAIRFFESFGFRVDGEIKDYYTPGVDAYKMRLDLHAHSELNSLPSELQ